jgi:hypothetical protein
MILVFRGCSGRQSIYKKENSKKIQRRKEINNIEIGRQIQEERVIGCGNIIRLNNSCI